MTVGALRPPFWPAIPVETAAPSVNPLSGAWHVAHDTLPSLDSRGSKYRSRPSSALAADQGLSSGHWTGGSPRGGCGGWSGLVSAERADSNPTSGNNTIADQSRL